MRSPRLHVAAAVHAGVVDESLPSDGGAGFFEVDPHDDLEPVGVGVSQWRQATCVVQSGHRVVYRARPYDHQESIIATGKDVGDLGAMACNRHRAGLTERQFVTDLLRGGNGAKGDDPPVGGAFDGSWRHW